MQRKRKAKSNLAKSNGKMFSSAITLLTRARKDISNAARKNSRGVSAKHRNAWSAIERQLVRAQTRVRQIARKAA